MNKVAAFALRRKNSILSMSEKMFCPPQPLRFWITPACAGKRRSDWIIRSIYWDHPRACGEKTLCAMMPRATGGSPPRMRGKENLTIAGLEDVGITPACAGKRRSAPAPTSKARDHPRACWEKRFASASLDAYWGSPPHVQGKVADTLCAMSLMGITPAYAGKSRFPSSTAPYRRDHPRVCGEKVPITCVPKYALGSPPHVRGKDRDPHESLPTGRITPAYAGKRMLLGKHDRLCGDHPRVCGEKS